jgi:hypothetical protein
VNAGEFEIFSNLKILQRILNKTWMAEPKGSHGKGKSLPVIDIGCPTDMRVSLQDQNAEACFNQMRCGGEPTDARTNDNGIPIFPHTERHTLVLPGTGARRQPILPPVWKVTELNQVPLFD